MADVDWSSLEDIESFKQSMLTMNIPLDEIDAFVEQMKQAGGAVK
jgi:hypothetical protein